MHPFQNTLKRKLATGAVAKGLWVTLESASISEIAAELGYDWVVIDAEHGQLDFKEILEHIRAVRGSSTTPLVRIQEIEQGLIKRVLDLGAAGIIVPQVMGRGDVELAVRFAKYPPWGIRGVGGERATRWGLGLRAYTEVADEETMIIPLIETATAADALPEILAVRGVDAIFIGPADLSSSCGYLGQWEGPGVAERILEIRRKAAEQSVPCGIMSTSIADAQLRMSQGFQMLGLGSDTGLLIRASQEAMRTNPDGRKEMG